jgi:hypothetical protein
MLSQYGIEEHSMAQSNTGIHYGPASTDFRRPLRPNWYGLPSFTDTHTYSHSLPTLLTLIKASNPGLWASDTSGFLHTKSELFVYVLHSYRYQPGPGGLTLQREYDITRITAQTELELDEHPYPHFHGYRRIPPTQLVPAYA